MLKNYLKIAVRYLFKHKAYSLINITGLAVGVSCCILILLYVQDELSFDRYHRQAAQIYRLVTDVQTESETNYQANSAAELVFRIAVVGAGSLCWPLSRKLSGVDFVRISAGCGTERRIWIHETGNSRAARFGRVPICHISSADDRHDSGIFTIGVFAKAKSGVQRGTNAGD